MKMAKASEADMNMALKLCSALEAVDRRFFPEGSEGDNAPEDLDLNNDAHCGQVLRHLYEVLQGGSIGRVWVVDIQYSTDAHIDGCERDFTESSASHRNGPVGWSVYRNDVAQHPRWNDGNATNRIKLSDAVYSDGQDACSNRDCVASSGSELSRDTPLIRQ
jgi:hypothetical protein